MGVVRLETQGPRVVFLEELVEGLGVARDLDGLGHCAGARHGAGVHVGWGRVVLEFGTGGGDGAAEVARVGGCGGDVEVWLVGGEGLGFGGGFGGEGGMLGVVLGWCG